MLVGNDARGLDLMVRVLGSWYQRPMLEVLKRPELHDGQWQLATVREAWQGNKTHQQLIVSYEAGRSDRDALVGTAWVGSPREEVARWQARGADGVVVTARTPADVDALVTAAARW